MKLGQTDYLRGRQLDVGLRFDRKFLNKITMCQIVKKKKLSATKIRCCKVFLVKKQTSGRTVLIENVSSFAKIPPPLEYKIVGLKYQ